MELIGSYSSFLLWPVDIFMDSARFVMDFVGSLCQMLKTFFFPLVELS